MDDMERKVNSPEYKNWIKGTLAIVHICEAVRVYTKHVFEQFKQSLSDGSHFDGGFNANWMCKNTKWEERNGKWTFTASSVCRPCTILFNEVVRLHLKRDKSMGFINGRTKQVAGCWGIAKIFMPHYCQDIETPEDTDPYALFHMISNCPGLFPVSAACVEKVIKGRNEMMHSQTNTLTDQDIRTYIQAMKDFLQEASSKVTGPSRTVQDALDKARREIDELLRAEMNTDILSKEAKQALTFKKEYITKSVNRITQSGENAKELKDYLQILEKLGGELQFWNRHPWEIRKVSELNEVRDQLETATKKNERLKEDLKKSQNDLQNHQKTAIEMDQFQKELYELQEKLKAITTENKSRKNELAKVQDELDMSKKQKEKLQEELGVVRKHMIEVDKEHNTMKSELKSVHESVEHTNEENKSLQEQVSTFSKRVHDVNEENEKNRHELHVINQELSSAKDYVRKKVGELAVHRSDDKSQIEESQMLGDRIIPPNENNEFGETLGLNEQENQMVTDQNVTSPEERTNIQEPGKINDECEQLDTAKADKETTENQSITADKEVEEKQTSDGQGNTEMNTEIYDVTNVQDSG